MWIVSLYKRQGYHQILAFRVDREKLALFAIDNQKYTFLFILFGSTDVPGLYSFLMNNFKYKWGIIFIETLFKIVTLASEQVTVTETY